MDVLHKFRSTVTSTMSQLSTVLPGNPVTREYEATKHIASAGVGMYYLIFSSISLWNCYIFLNLILWLVISNVKLFFLLN